MRALFATIAAAFALFYAVHAAAGRFSYTRFFSHLCDVESVAMKGLLNPEADEAIGFMIMFASKASGGAFDGFMVVADRPDGRGAVAYCIYKKGKKLVKWFPANGESHTMKTSYADFIDAIYRKGKERRLSTQ